MNSAAELSDDEPDLVTGGDCSGPTATPKAGDL